MSVPDPDGIAAALGLEAEFNLLSRRIAGVQYWPLLRIGFAGSGGDAEPLKRRIGPRIVSMLIDDVRLGLKPNWARPGIAQSILIPFHRKEVVGGQVQDRFSQRLLNEPRFGPWLVLEGDLTQQHLSSRPGLDVGVLNHGRTLEVALSALDAGALMDDALAEHAWLDEACRGLLGRAFPISARTLARRVARFARRRAGLRYRLARTGARRLFSTVSDPALFSAARQIGLETIQIQHGAIGPHNLGCHFPGRPLVESFADRYWMFGGYWTSCVELPSNCQAQVMGSATLEAARAAAAQKTPRTLLAFSQPPTEPRLLEIVVEAARRAPDWRFVFRPHPREDAQGYESRFLSLRPPPNIRLSPASEDPYSLLAACEVQLGVWSTMLFEGMALGARTIVLDLPGAWTLTPAIKAGDAVLAKSAQEVVEALATAPKARRGEAYFAPQISSEALWTLAAGETVSSANS